jgi:hypothetical protein
MTNLLTKTALAGLMGLTAIAGAASPAAAQPHESMGGVVGCEASGGRQEAGAVIGAILGGVIGNRVARGEPGAGTAIGAVLGAGAGSYIGCRSQHDREPPLADNGGYYGVRNYGGYRLAPQVSPARYTRSGERMVATSNLTIRSAPTTRSAPLGTLRAGQRFQALAEVRGSDWVLVGRNGVGVGYVHGAYIVPEGAQYAWR